MRFHDGVLMTGEQYRRRHVWNQKGKTMRNRFRPDRDTHGQYGNQEVRYVIFVETRRSLWSVKTSLRRMGAFAVTKRSVDFEHGYLLEFSHEKEQTKTNIPLPVTHFWRYERPLYAARTPPSPTKGASGSHLVNPKRRVKYE